VALSDFKAKYKVNKFYSYVEEKVAVTPTVSNIFYGWEQSDVIDTSQKLVLSTASKSKKVTDDEASWSKQEGISATSLADYRRYFVAATGESPENFLDKWKDSLDKLESLRESENPQYRSGEGDFLIKLSRLIVSGDKFVKFGRIYKVISP
jgi:hypothetical protein